MATDALIREGLKTRLDTIADWQASAYELANPTPPVFEVHAGEIEYDQAMGRGLDEWTYIVRGYVGAASDIGAAKKLGLARASTGAGSVKAAVEGDTTLGGAVADCQVVSCSATQIYSRAGGPELLGCEWTVQVIATGD